MSSCRATNAKREEVARERGPAITRADARELLEMSDTTTSDACYDRVRAALREYAGGGFECHVRNPLDEAIARAEKAERELQASESCVAFERVTIAELRLEAHQLRTNLHLARLERAEIDQLSLLLSESREDAARLRAELDRRLDIPADVLSRVEWTVRADRSKGGTFEDMMDVAEALQAHAQKAVKLSPRDREEPTGPWKAVKP